MARKPRVVAPSFPHHVTQRGNRRQKTFFCVDDYLSYIELLIEFSTLAETRIWAYCLDAQSCASRHGPGPRRWIKGRSGISDL